MKNGTCWTDDAGRPIQAHGGMIARFGKKWYWYGQNMDTETKPVASVGTRIDVVGVSCYSSADLRSWHYEGLALAADPDTPANHPLNPANVMERPKVLYNRKTGKYVMWYHFDDPEYMTASAACAVADRPEGPFTFLHAAPPNRRDCRDITVFQEPDSDRAFVFHCGDWNKTAYLSELNDEYTGFTGLCIAQLENQEREGLTLMRRDGIYYCVSSGCTGWDPNPLLYATTRFLEVPMQLRDNPCEGEGYRTGFDGQSTWIFEAGGTYYLMLDHWHPDDLRASCYSILPIDFDEKGRMTVAWRDEFDPKL